MSGMMTILKNVRRYKRMKRKELEKLPVLQATTAMLEQAEKNRWYRPDISEKNCAMNTSTTPDASGLIGF